MDGRCLFSVPLSSAKSSLMNKANRVAKVVDNERPVAPTVLRGLVQEEASNSTEKLKRQLQSTSARLEKVEKLLESSKKEKPTKKSPKNDKGGGKKKPPPSATKSRRSNSPQGSAKGTTAGGGKKKKSQSKGKSNGNKGASKSKRRN